MSGLKSLHMVELPSFMSEAIRNCETTLGDNPAFPPSRGNGMLVSLVAERYGKICEAVGDISTEDASSELSDLMTRCLKHESGCREALETECVARVLDLIKVPEDFLNIKAEIVDKVDMSGLRSLPEDSTDYTFDSIADMRSMTNEVYKRRFMNALVCGAAFELANDVQSYLSNVFKIDPELPSIYKRMIDLNNFLMFSENSVGSQTDGGKVEVVVGNEDEKVLIKAQGTTFPFLYAETIKGLLEIAASHGLPSERRKAEYVAAKSDYTTAELWDTRLGSVLWDRIYSQVTGVEPNLLILKLAKMPTDEFNNAMGEIIACTKTGEEILAEVVDEIEYDVDREDFDQYMDSQRDRYQINDGEYMSKEDLLVDCEEY